MNSIERRQEILKRLQTNGMVSIQSLADELQVSSMTIRRDLNRFADQGLVRMESGGALLNSSTLYEHNMTIKSGIMFDEKVRIAQKCLDFIKEGDSIFLDAGTTTGYILDYLPVHSATFVTNAVSHAKRLAAAGNRVILIGGELKGTTEAVVGSQAILAIQSYHFTKGFFGTNGVSKRHGFTTPDPSEALVKQAAMRQTENCYVLADSQKFGTVSSVTFAPFDGAIILTETEVPEGFAGSKNVRIV